MDAVQAVVDLARENEELSDQLSKYEDWFDSLVGSSVTLSVKTKKEKTRYVNCTVTEFDEDDGTWVLTADEDGEGDPEVFEASFEDFVKGRLVVNL